MVAEILSAIQREKNKFVYQLITMHVHITFIQCNNGICNIFVLFVCIII